MAKGISQTPIQADGRRKKGKKEMKTKSKKQADPAKKNATPKKQDHAKKTECPGFISLLADVLAAIIEPLGDDGVVRVFTIRRSSSKPAPSVPTADRIKIDPSVKKQCKEALKKGEEPPVRLIL